MQSRILLCVSGVALGGCFAFTTTVFAFFEDDSQIPERSYFILSLVGQVISLIGLVSCFFKQLLQAVIDEVDIFQFILSGIAPWLIKKLCKDSE